MTCPGRKVLVFGAAAILIVGTANGAARRFDQPFVFADPSLTAGWSVAGDVNLDGKLDLVLAVGAGTLSVKIGDGLGSFTTLQTFPAGGGMALGDVNGDSYPDLVSPSLVKLNNGDGTFGPELSISGGGNHIQLHDMNGDAKHDMVYVDSGLRVRLGNGDGTFGAFTFPFTTPSAPFNLTMADVNADGKIDALAPNQGPSAGVVSVFLATGNASLFQPRIDFATGAGPRAVAIGDLNEDGNVDAAIGSYGSSPSTATVHLGNGDGTFGAGSALAANDMHSAAIADFNQDSHLDIAFGNDLSGFLAVEVFPGNGNGTFGPKTTWDFLGVRPMVAVHVDTDASWDLLAGDGLLLGNGDGTFGKVRRATTGVGPHQMAIADLDGDGFRDVVTPNFNSASVTVALGDGTGSFSSTASYTTGNTPESVALADFDHNGFLDIATANAFTATVSILLASPGGGGFGPRTDLPFPDPWPMDVAAADLNGDGHADLVMGRFHSSGIFTVTGLVSVYLGDGSGGFSSYSDYSSPGGITDVDLVDMNADGTLDLVAAIMYATQQGVSVFLGDGTGGFFPPSSVIMTNRSNVGVVVADANLDGKLDVFKEHRLFYGNGDGTLNGSPVSLPVIGMVTAAGDLDGDGKPDVIMPSPGSNAVLVQYGDGLGGFPRAEYLGAGRSPYDVQMAHMDGSGASDLVVTNAGGANVTVLLNQTSVVAVGPPTGGTSLTLHGHPNPARSVYRVSFRLAKSAAVSVRLLDAAGRRVRTLELGTRPAGLQTATWDLRDRWDRPVPAGVYFVELRVADDVRRTRFAVLR